MNSNEDTPVSELTEPPITDETVIAPDPTCDVCGLPAEYDATQLIADDRVVKIIKSPQYVDTEDTHAVLCFNDYKDTKTYAYWRQYDYEETRAQELRAGIE